MAENTSLHRYGTKLHSLYIFCGIATCCDCQVAVQDTLNEQEGVDPVFNETRSPREERVPPLDLHPVDQR